MSLTREEVKRIEGRYDEIFQAIKKQWAEEEDADRRENCGRTAELPE